MNRASRIAAREQQTEKCPVGRPIDIFSPSALRQAFAHEQSSSERRWEKVTSSRAIAACRKACATLIAQEKLVVRTTKKPDKVPEIAHGFRFKYSGPEGYGSLGEVVNRMRKGEKIIVAWVEEAGHLIGYGIAVAKRNEVKIEIIDVDTDSRRQSGIGVPFKAGGQKFSVGVGHLVAATLADACEGLIRVDATNHGSRYIFKSLGFVPEKNSRNSCLLERP